MSDTLTEQWGTETGLLSDYEGTVAEAWFGKDPRREGDGADKIFLFWKMVNIVNEGEPVDDWTERFSIGNGWVPVENGTKIAREDGNQKRKINENTDYGRVINRVLGEHGGKEGRQYAEAFAGAADVLASRGTGPLDASSFVGFRFKIEAQEFSSRINGEDVTWTRNLPTAFLGVSDGADVPAPSASSNGDDKVARVKLVAELKDLARTSESHAQFLDKALEIDAVTKDNELLEQVADDTDAGLYAQARS